MKMDETQTVDYENNKLNQLTTYYLYAQSQLNENIT